MDILISLIVWALCSFGCYKIAESNGRDTTLAAVMGFIFGIFAIVVYAVIGKPKE
jgi:hypothetical protein